MFPYGYFRYFFLWKKRVKKRSVLFFLWKKNKVFLKKQTELSFLIKEETTNRVKKKKTLAKSSYFLPKEEKKEKKRRGTNKPQGDETKATNKHQILVWFIALWPII